MQVTEGPQWELRRVEETGSTNTDLLALARAGAPEGVVLAANHQSGGRGRRDRAWVAPPGSALLASVLLRPRLSADQVPLTVTMVALAAVDACVEVAGVRPGLKWPNDLVASLDPDDPSSERKLAGVLAESILGTEGTEAVVVGIGVNVVWPENPPSEMVERAVALNQLTDRRVDVELLLQALISALERRNALLASDEGRRELVADWRDHLWTLGRVVRVELSDERFEGVAEDVGGNGALIVRADGDERRAVHAADVVHLRPARGD